MSKKKDKLIVINGYAPGEFEQNICSQCNARCCRIGVWAPLRPDEYRELNLRATKLGRDVRLTLETVDDTPYVFVLRPKPNTPCGFLDLTTNRCLVYEVKPDYCTQFWCEAGYAIVQPGYKIGALSIPKPH